MFGIYFHIPFCIRRCPFCDFTLVTDAKEDLKNQYVQALCKEIELNRSQTPITSIYFGGGTPSILSLPHLGILFDALKKNFTWESNIEITFETNPEDITTEKAAAWKNLGINRISLGVQSMDDAQLTRLGRNHTESQVLSAFQTLRNAGINNISVDLMFGLENQSLDSWKQTLNKILHLTPRHISTYNLTIEKNTKYEKEFISKQLIVPSDEIQAQMLLEKKQILEEHGFDPYEISNAAQPGFESKHNMLYWTGKPYLGFGVSAHSFQNTAGKLKRYWNTKNIPTYIKNINSGKSVVEESEELDNHTHLQERLMTGLRLKKGIDLKKLEADGFSLPEKMSTQLMFLIQNKMIVKNGNIIQIPIAHIPITNTILLKLFE